ncbi:peroxisome biogenesis factor 10 [Drosophila obscura]|uniref:peroxisome biogenesis factor 10 n=1 Tax=Drosophila obscura TaxID=7282 RepID=UPI001BB272B5|nr:peroxisome biogenesis factor 10 [Drosophila obscura]
MDFRNARARQPEIVRSVQKDARYTNELAEEFSDVLRLTGPRNWIKFNQMCKLLAELSYHGFSSVNNLQTLGEEYTGIIQVDGNYKQIPSRLMQLLAIVLEFGGDALFQRLLQKLDLYIAGHEEIRPEAKQQLKRLIHRLKQSPSYVKALHKSLFYLNASKYQLSKRTTAINYVLIRHWLQPEFSLYGYKILGVITFLQVTVSLAINSLDAWREHKRQQLDSLKHTAKRFLQRASVVQSSDCVAPQCILCLEPRTSCSLTPCGHIFCWGCILEWLEERDECPLCRESLKKSQVIQLQNYA